jgi:hypothetical protein
MFPVLATLALQAAIREPAWSSFTQVAAVVAAVIGAFSIGYLVRCCWEMRERMREMQACCDKLDELRQWAHDFHAWVVRTFQRAGYGNDPTDPPPTQPTWP